jgi:hypothetical protein
MNVEIGAEAALFPEKEYLNGIFVAVKDGCPRKTPRMIRVCQLMEAGGGPGGCDVSH